MAENPLPDTAEVKTPTGCKDCGNTGKVRLTLRGASGNILREVSCPSCDMGVALDAGIVNAGELRNEFNERLKALAFLVGLALALGAMAVIFKAKPPEAWATVLHEGTDT